MRNNAAMSVFLKSMLSLSIIIFSYELQATSYEWLRYDAERYS